MKIGTIILLFAFVFNSINAQTTKTDSLKYQLSIAIQDTSKVLIMAELCSFYRPIKQDSAIMYGLQAIELAQKLNYSKKIAHTYLDIGASYRNLGNQGKALDYLFKGLQLAEIQQDSIYKGLCLRDIGAVYGMNLKDYTKGLNYCQQARHLFINLNNEKEVAQTELGIGAISRINNHLDSAVYYEQKAYTRFKNLNLAESSPTLFLTMGGTQLQLGNHPLALEYLRKSLHINQIQQNHNFISTTNYRIALVYRAKQQTDSCIYYAQKSFDEANTFQLKQQIVDASNLLAEVYESRDINLAHNYLKIAKTTNEELNGSQKILELQNTISDEQERQRKVEEERIAHENLLKQYAFGAGSLILLLIVFLLYRNNHQQKRAKKQLQQKNEVIEQTLTNLKSTQAQLIQSEKLASLGELTAGIAHEIQNPLNFVNNFSELSVDLVKDLKEEIEKTEQDKEYIGELFDDLSQNQEKINHHGKRASSIVKGMLEHSRASTGVKEMTDINKLADEYLRLAYHACLSGRQGLRAKDKDFNVDFNTEFDENLPKVNIIPQDIGRVLLNLINNAFYAVNEKNKRNTEGGYKPAVSVSTHQVENHIIIKVKDNGIGMSEATKAKVFQPFFTTKPTGQGTGLGLSLAYDIVTKGHGGTLEVQSTEGVGSEFIITLPFKANE
jgi:two-component system, NtrC family, sensor kinase